MIFSLSLSLAAVLLAAPAPGKAASSAQSEAASVEKAADSAASAAESASKAAVAAEHAAEAAEKAAEAAAAAAQAAQKAIQTSPSTVVSQAAGATVTTVTTPQAVTVTTPPAAPPPPEAIWTSLIDLGLIALTGNSQTLAFNLGGNVQRKGAEWIWGIKGSAQYGQTRDNTTGENTVTAEAATAQLRGDKRITPAFTGYLLAGIDADHIKSIEERPYSELGVSLTWFEVKEGDLLKSTFRTDLGFRYGREYRFQYIPTPLSLGEVDIVAPHLGVGYRYAVSKEIIFTNDLDLVANLQGDARLMMVNTAKLAARLTSSLNLAVSFIINSDSLPPPSKLSTDTALTVGVEIAM